MNIQIQVSTTVDGDTFWWIHNLVRNNGKLEWVYIKTDTIHYAQHIHIPVLTEDRANGRNLSLVNFPYLEGDLDNLI